MTPQEFSQLITAAFPKLPAREAADICKRVPLHLRKPGYVQRAVRGHARHAFSDYEFLCSSRSSNAERNAAKEQVASQVSEVLAYWQTGEGVVPVKRGRL